MTSVKRPGRGKRLLAGVTCVALELTAGRMLGAAYIGQPSPRLDNASAGKKAQLRLTQRTESLNMQLNTVLSEDAGRPMRAFHSTQWPVSQHKWTPEVGYYRLYVFQCYLRCDGKRLR